MTRSRIVSFAHSVVAVESAGARAAAIVDFLFRDAPSDDPGEPHVTLRIGPGLDPQKLAVSRDAQWIYESDSDADLAEFLLGEVSFHLADRSRGGLVFHAGALAYRGCGILIPGAIGAGKTTLTAWWVTRGLDYLTDEMVWVPEGADSIRALTRPLNVKRPARLALQSVFNFEGHAAQILSSARTDLIPPAALKPDNALSAPRVSLIVFPNYQPDGEPRVQPLTKAQAGFALFQTLVNARNLPDLGFPETVRLAQQAPAYRVRYSRFEQIQQPLEDLLTDSQSW